MRERFGEVSVPLRWRSIGFSVKRNTQSARNEFQVSSNRAYQTEYQFWTQHWGQAIRR
jgi:hypothetical protein